MAEAAQAPPADPVAGLIDIPLPDAVSLWPQTWPARIAVVLAVAGLILAAWYFIRTWHANRYRRAALAELDRIAGAAPAADVAATLAVLGRRTALAAFPRAQVAALAGTAWLTFLDRSYGGDEFSRGPGTALGAAAYAPARPSAQDSRALIDLVRR